MDLWKCAIVRNLFEKKTKHLALAFLKKKKRKKSIDHHILWMACWISSGTTGRCFFWNNYFPFVFTGTIQHLSIALRWIWICSVTLSVVFWRMFNSTCKNLLFQFHLKKFCTEQFYCKPTLNGALRIDLVQL